MYQSQLSFLWSELGRLARGPSPMKDRFQTRTARAALGLHRAELTKEIIELTDIVISGMAEECVGRWRRLTIYLVLAAARRGAEIYNHSGTLRQTELAQMEICFQMSNDFLLRWGPRKRELGTADELGQKSHAMAVLPTPFLHN
jgi:hypothetical protein